MRKSYLPFSLEVLKKHAAIVGASGSGKTVAAKVILEELVLSGIPVIAIDPQGDIASMAMKSSDKDWEKLVHKTVYTPASDAGCTLSLNPLTLPPVGTSPNQVARIVPAIAENIAQIVGYDVRNALGRTIVSVLDHVIFGAFEKGVRVTGIPQMVKLLEKVIDEPDRDHEHAQMLADCEYEGDKYMYDMMMGSWRCDRKRIPNLIPPNIEKPKRVKIPKPMSSGILKLGNANEIEELTRRLRQLSSGSKRFLYCQGAPITIPELTKAPAGRTRLSVVYLNSLYAPEEKMAVVAQLATNLYGWMLSHPSPKLQVVLYIDEIAQFLPAGTRKTAAKEALRLLFKQGRKYGVGVIMATQNPGDADYKSMAQANTWLIGRMMLKQDIAKVGQIYNSLAFDADTLRAQLPRMNVGAFHVVCPDAFEGIKDFTPRMPLTPHVTLDEDDIEKEIFSRKCEQN